MLLNARPDRFALALAARGLPSLRRRVPTTLQVNMGKLCNLACRHCHVDAGPQRTELMDRATVDRVLEVVAASPDIGTVDITGGAPELNPHFRALVEGVRALDRIVLVRCNLTVLHEPGQEDTGSFYARQGVRLVASLPCYTQENVDKQRGGGAFDGSVRALKQLNALGYGAAEGAATDDAGDASGKPDGSTTGPAAAPATGGPLRLDLVFNPVGPSLPPAQETLERDYRQRLAEDFGIRFDHLLAVANIPIHRFAEDLQRQGRLESYEQLLEDSFNPAAADDVMCRDLVSVDWDGSLADCDFNQMLGMPLGNRARTIHDVTDLATLADSPVTTASHCLGCTAGQGSSCGGALARNPDD